MKILLLTLIFFLIPSLGGSQILLSATSDDGSGYDAVKAAGLDFESPDCIHTGFGPHISQEYDDEMERNIFRFHSHIVEDNDRCQVFDRVRMEIKGGPNTNPEAQHLLGSESFYRWKFKIPEAFVGSTSFCHIFQNKIKGGDDSYPVITITPRASKLEIIHSGGDSGEDLGELVNVDLEPFLGAWIEAYVYQFYAEEGSLHIKLKDLRTGELLVDYSNTNIDLWRDGAEYARPKWGIYRKKVEGLKDETIDFADFCISEQSEDLCPEDNIIIVDKQAPTIPGNLLATRIWIDQVDLMWDASEDNFAVSSYIVYANGDSLWSGGSTNVRIEGLEGSSNYTFAVRAFDAAGNQSGLSNEVEITTDPPSQLPGQAFNPYPENGVVGVEDIVKLRWEIGENTDSSLVYFGNADNLDLLAVQADASLEIQLEHNTNYYWQIGQKNENGTTLGPLWSFTTGDQSNTERWLIYRGDDRPDVETEFLELRDAPEDPSIDEVLVDPSVPSNNIYQYYEEGEDKFRWRHEFLSSDTAYTVVARIKGFESSNNIAYFEVKLAGVREKVRINHGTIKLEKSIPIVEKEFDFNFDAAFHIIRVTMQNQVMKVYLDEAPVPFAIGYTETEDSGSNFEFGKSGGNATGCFVDWMVALPNHAYSPNEGPPLPEDLILSNDASLSKILIDGEELESFNKETFIYKVSSVSEELPEIEVFTSSSLATYTIDTTTSELTTALVFTILAQDNFNKETYELRFSKSSHVENFFYQNLVKVFPNPSNGIFTIELPDNHEARVMVFDTTGVLASYFEMNESALVEDKLRSGLYIVEVSLSQGRKVYKKVIIR